VVAVVVTVVVVALLPALVAYRYTSPVQRAEFVSKPWRGWSFAAAALRVPGDSELKTSGDALRKADWLFRDTAVDPFEVQLLFVTAGAPYRFSQDVDGVLIERDVTPRYRFIWEVRGTVPETTGVDAEPQTMVVALLDYQTGHLLYDVRGDLPEDRLHSPDATPSSSSSATP